MTTSRGFSLGHSHELTRLSCHVMCSIPTTAASHVQLEPAGGLSVSSSNCEGTTCRLHTRASAGYLKLTRRGSIFLTHDLH